MDSVTTEGLSIRRGDIPVLEHVDIRVGNGEFVAVVGKSGSGKTSFLHALAGLIPFSGRVDIPGRKGMVFQHYAVFPWLTVSQNITFGLDGLDEKRKSEILDEHLKLARLQDKRDAYPAELSGGQIQRVALARSLAPDPDVLLMDEPYGALDAYTRDQMQGWLLDVWTKRRKTVIFVTHDIEEAIFLADRVFVLRDRVFAEEFPVRFERPRDGGLKFSGSFNALKSAVLKAL